MFVNCRYQIKSNLDLIGIDFLEREPIKNTKYVPQPEKFCTYPVKGTIKDFMCIFFIINLATLLENVVW